MANQTKASSMLTIMDVSDIKLSTYISANYPTTQIYDSNAGTYAPSWTNLKITPVIFVNDKAVSLTDSSLNITYKRQDGNSTEAALTAGETAASGILTVNQNKLASASSGIITYICYIVYTDPNSKVSVNAKNTLTFSLVKQGGNAHTVSIDGEQLFKYDKNSTLSGPSQITLTASVQNVTIAKWQYKKADGAWADYPTTSDNANITSGSLVVKPSHAVFFNNVATIKVTTSDNNCYDVHSITKLYDGATGAAGASAVNVIMQNEAEVFPCTNDGLVSPARTVTSAITAYKGTTAITPTVTLPTAPSGMTITQATSGNTVTVTMTAANNATLGNAATMSGTLDFTISAGGISGIKKAFSWSKSPKGNTGAAGADAIIFDCTFTSGNVIMNGEGSCPIGTIFYKGATQITSGITYKWSKFVNSTWSDITGATSSSFTATPDHVTSATTFRCAATYSGKTYYAYATVIDKSDPYSCELFSTVGLQLKNSDGVGAIYCKVWQNGVEVDPLKTTTFSQTAPSSPANGDFYYKIDKAAKTVTLMKYNGTAWAAATGSDLPQFTYNWSTIDKLGNILDTPTTWSGKAVYIDGSLVDEKLSVIVEVE